MKEIDFTTEDTESTEKTKIFNAKKHKTQRRKDNLMKKFAPLRLMFLCVKKSLKTSVFSVLSVVKLTIFSLLIFLLTQCSRETSSESNITIFADNIMTIDYRILIGKKLDNNEKEKIQNIISNVFQEGNSIYNRWNPDSELSQLNKNQAGSWPLSSKLEALLHTTDEIVILSDGKFDPTIEPLQQLWKREMVAQKIPEKAEIEKISAAIGWKHISIGEKVFSKDHDATALDLGGIAKGYIVDQMVERLNHAGYKDVYVEWGGEIRVSGQHPDKRNWTIFISRLGSLDLDDAIAVVELKDQAIATSGDYNQFWKIKNEAGDEITYFHIIDPKKMEPLKVSHDSIRSVSVLAPTCALADGLATVAMMFENVAEAEAWAIHVQKKHPDVKFWIVKNSSRHLLRP